MCRHIVIFIIAINILIFCGCATSKWVTIGSGAALGAGVGGTAAWAIVWQKRGSAAAIGAASGAATGALAGYLLHRYNSSVYKSSLEAEKKALKQAHDQKIVELIRAGCSQPKAKPIFIPSKVQDGRVNGAKVDWEWEKRQN